jgi:hypothetical protein
MTLFLKKICLLAGLVFGPLLAILLLPFPYDHDLSAIIDKVRLLKEGKGGRIVLVGGSGLLFGIDSEMMETRFQRPVINFGLWAGFGITALLREIKPHLRPGDVLIVSPEYTVVFDRYDPVAAKWIYALAPARNALPLYKDTEGGIRTFISDLNGLVRSKLRAFPEVTREIFETGSLRPLLREGRVSYHKYFNTQGDSLRSVRIVPSPNLLGQFHADYFSHPGYEGQSLDAFNALCRGIMEQGIPVLFVFPAYAEEEFRRQKQGMRRYEQRLRRELCCPILGTPDDFLYPYNVFTDTVHHLNHKGRRRRTQRMIALLQDVPALAVRSHEPYASAAR